MADRRVVCESCRGIKKPEKIALLRGQAFCEWCLKEALQNLGKGVTEEADEK